MHRLSMTQQKNPQGPVARRAPSSRSALNTSAILKALTKEATELGLDAVSAGSVAKRAGLTSGAIYSRYENNDEMLIALWQNVVAPVFGAHCKETIAAIVSTNPSAQDSNLLAQIEKPNHILGLGAEFIVVAQRNEVIGEVVVAEVGKWLSDAGLNSSSTPIQRAGVAIGASLAIGAILRSFITGSNPGLRLIVSGIHNAYAGAKPTTAARKSLTPKPIRSDTQNPLRDALIDATAEVMSKTGFTGATISRIARKSDITSGSIYNFYADKESLMNDSVSELMRTTQRQNLDSKKVASSLHKPNFGLTDSFDFGLIPDRRTWLRFRQECIIATRHHKKTHKEMKKVITELNESMTQSFPHLSPAVVNLVSMGEQAIGYGYSSLFGYTNLFDKCDFDAIMVQVAKQNSL